MSDHDYINDQNTVIKLRVWALGQMVWGAFMAGAVLVGIGAILLAIWVVSLLLPEASKQAPSPYTTLQIEQSDRVA
jgi:hypothetical protein